MVALVAVTFLLCTSGVSFLHGFLLDTLTNHIPHEVCYGDYGCFSNGPPFLSTHRPLSVAPESPEHIGARFLLYTRANPTVADEQVLNSQNEESISLSHFRGDKDTKIIIHGFTHDGHRPWIQNMTTELLRFGDFNVIAVDWHKGAVLPYEQATANTRVVGAQIAKLIEKLMQVTSTTADKFHIIGHSLGAHTAGYAGERISHVKRITGLDPASPYFENTDIRVRLDPSDADFVDVVHTDGGGLKNIGFGVTQAVGHLDFYPNGGAKQPGCTGNALDKLGSTTWAALSTMMNYYAAEAALACSHERSYDYFTESINAKCKFTAFKCANQDEFHKGHCLNCNGQNLCARMGYHASMSDATGSLYLETESSATFCDYNYQINISSTNSFDGILTLTLVGSNGQIGPLALMSSNEVFIGSSIISKRFSSRIEIGNITSLTLHYEKTNALLVGNLYSNDWHMNGIAILNVDKQKQTNFCASQKEVDNHNSTTFAVDESGSC